MGTIVMLRDLKPRVLQGKDGLLSLPANIDLRPDAPLQGGGVVPRQAHNLETRVQFPPLLPEAERPPGQASSAPITDHLLARQVSRPGRPRSLRPLIWLVILGWALFIAVATLGRAVLG